MTKMYDYQQHGVDRLLELGGRGLLADEPGLGKSIQALQFLSKAEESFPALVVCPATLKFNWEAEARKHMGWDSEVLSGKRPPSRWAPSERLTIINYDILHDWQATLVGKFNTVVLDESHYLQNRTAKRTKAARQVASGVRYCLALTGTPVLNRPCDLWPTLNILRPKLFPSYHPFGVRYGNARKTHWGWDYSGASNTAELHQILTEKVMVRRTKKEVLTELPDKTIVVSPVELPASGMKEYQLAEKDFMKWLVRNKPHRLTSAMRAEQLSKLGEMKRIAGRHKVKLVLEWVKDFLASGQKLVLFAIHRAVIDEIRAALGRDCVTITGDTAQKDRQMAVEAFQGKKGPRVFLGNIRAAGVGITLTRSSTVLFAELDWVPAVMSQASDRVHRISQKENVLINFLVARNTIEESLMRVLQEKQAVADDVIDGAGGGGDFDVYDRLCEELGRKK